MSMRGRSIIYLVNSLSTGGAEVQVVELARRMTARGWRVAVVTLLDTTDQKPALEAAGIPHVSLRMRRGWPDPRAAARLARVLRARRPDVLHTHMVQSNLLGRVARLFAPVPVLVSTSHSVNEGGRWRYRVYRATAGLADLVTAVSAATARRHAETRATPDHKLRVVPNGIDTSRFSFDAAARERLRRDEAIGDAFCWLAVGRFEEAKDYPNLLRAFARVSGARPDSLLLIAGHGPLQDDARRLVQQLGLSKRVRFLGLRRDVPDLMSAADGYVMSSAWEGLPMVLLEAAATGLPIVATRVGGIPEAVIDGRSGLLVPPADDAALGEAMLKLMRLPAEERKSMGAAGSAHAKANFDIESVTTAWESIYDELLRTRRNEESPRVPGAHGGARLLHVTTVPMSLIFFRGQVGYMKSRGFQIQALSSPGPELAEFGAREGVATHAVSMPRQLTPLRDLFAVARIWRRVRRVRPDIVHAHTPKGGLLGMIAAFLARVPVRIYHVRGLPFMTAAGWRRRLLRATERVSCRLAHQVLCVSHSLREVAVEEKLCAPDKIKVLAGGSGNGVDAGGRFNPENSDPGSRRERREAYDIPASATVVGFVGRLVRDKGVVELVAAWRRLREQHPEAHLLVVGPFEERDPVPGDVAESLRSDPRVHLSGMQRDLPPLYAAMDLVVLPTYREGFPNVPLEAAAMALPVVATRIPGCVDAVADGVTGTLVPPRDADALEAAIKSYLADGGLRRRHGEAGRARVLREFRQEVIWQELYKDYCRLLADRGVALPAEFERRAASVMEAVAR